MDGLSACLVELFARDPNEPCVSLSLTEADVSSATSAAAAALGGGVEVPPEMATQAQQIWQMLDDLADSDPSAYQAFISQQKEAVDVDRGFVHPDPGMVLKAALARVDPAAKLPSLPNKPDLEPLRAASSGSKVLINLCTSQRVQAPSLPDGRAVAATTAGPAAAAAADRPPVASAREAAAAELNLTIHTAVGAARSVPGHGGKATVVVDILVHPWVLQHMQQSSTFHSAVVDFALGTVEEAAGCHLARPGKVLSATYRGWAGMPGPASGLCTTWPFYLRGKPPKAQTPTVHLTRPKPAPAKEQPLTPSAVVSALGGEERPGIREVTSTPLQPSKLTAEQVTAHGQGTVTDGAFKWVFSAPSTQCAVQDVLVSEDGKLLALGIGGHTVSVSLAALLSIPHARVESGSLVVKRAKGGTRLVLRGRMRSA